MRFCFVAPVPRLKPTSTGALLSGVVFCLLAILMATAAGPSRGQIVDGTSAMGAGPAKAASGAARTTRSPTSPLWSELTAPQQQALAPLSAAWPSISEAQKRKWLVISQSYGRLPAPEQAKLHSRMTEWVALSPQQRAQARLSFAESKQLSPDDKKAKWEEYQALPPEQKRRLAAGAASVAKPPATATAVKPVSPRKLATVPNQVDSNTPLPQQVSPAPPAPVH